MPTVSPDSRGASPPDIASPDGDESRRAMLTAEQQQKQKQVTPRYSIRESSRRSRGLDTWSLVSGGNVLGRSRKTLTGDQEAGHSWGVGSRERRSILGGGYSTTGFPAAEHRSPFLTARSPSEGLPTWRSPMDQSSVNPFSASFGGGGERGSPTPGGGGNVGEGKGGGSVQPLLGRGSGGYGGTYGSRWEGTGGGVFWGGGGGGGGGTEGKVSSSKKTRIFGHTLDDQGDVVRVLFYVQGHV